MSVPADRSDAERVEAIRQLARRVGLSEAWAAAISGAGLTVAEIFFAVSGSRCPLPSMATDAKETP